MDGGKDNPWAWRGALAGPLLVAALLLAGAPAPAQYLRLSGGPYDSSFSGMRASVTNITVTPASLSGYVPDDKYKLRIGDKVRFQILEDRDLPCSLVVTDSGELDIPYIGPVTAVGKTSKGLIAELKVKLEKEFYHRATVVLRLDEANKLWGRIYVYGQVKTQGRIEIAMHENITAGKAILLAGGFGDFAKKTKVKVIRGGTDTAAKQTIELNMEDILEKGMIEKDVPLQPEDCVVVPSRSISM
jgi:protein involved in polysaccharide export with SLBB domain